MSYFNLTEVNERKIISSMIKNFSRTFDVYYNEQISEFSRWKRDEFNLK